MKLSVILALVGVAFAAALPLADSERVTTYLNSAWRSVPVTDTEEVVQAKAEFKAAYDAAAAAAAVGELPEVIVPQGAPLPVADTEEVAAAKAEFQAAYDAAAAAAEAAPDYDLDGAISTHTGYLSTINGRLSPYYTNTLPYGAYGLHAPVLAGGHHVVGSPFVGAHHAVGSPYVAGAHHVVGSPYVAGSHHVVGSPYVAGSHHVVGSPYVAGAHHVVGSPYVAGAHHVVAGGPTVSAGTHLIAGHPLAYNGLGFGFPGHGYGLQSAFESKE